MTTEPTSRAVTDDLEPYRQALRDHAADSVREFAEAASLTNEQAEQIMAETMRAWDPSWRAEVGA